MANDNKGGIIDFTKAKQNKAKSQAAIPEPEVVEATTAEMIR